MLQCDYRLNRPRLSHSTMLGASALELPASAAVAAVAAAATAAVDEYTVRAIVAGRGQRAPGHPTTATGQQRTEQVSTTRPRMPIAMLGRQLRQRLNQLQRSQWQFRKGWQ